MKFRFYKHYKIPFHFQELNGRDLGGSPLEISLAKPPSDKKKKEDMLRKREQRMMQAMAER